MEIKIIKDRKKWDKWVSTFNDFTFLQSWDWGEINNSDKEFVVRLALFDKRKLVGLAQAFTISARRGKIFFVPHGPLLKNQHPKYWKAFFNFLVGLAQKNNCLCLRISPWLPKQSKSAALFSNFGFKPAPVIMHTEDTWLIDITGTEDEVMARMRKTTRNLIRRAIKEKVKVKSSQKIEDVDILYKLQLEVVKRNNFVPFSKQYLKRELKQFFNNNSAVLLLGKHDKNITGAALIIFMDKFAFYYQSGSQTTKVPVNYLIQWQAILEARTRGCQIYNMWGVSPLDQKDHPWYGLTLFKTGFGGQLKQYMHARDFPLSPKYYFLRLIEKIPKTLRQKIK